MDPHGPENTQIDESTCQRFGTSPQPDAIRGKGKGGARCVYNYSVLACTLHY